MTQHDAQASALIPASPGLCVEDLLAPAAFAHPVAQCVLRQTLLSWIILTGDFAYKIKKPVKLDFIDASTLERRRALCEEELRLNRRFASDLYLGVVPITRDVGGLRVGGAGPVVEYAVRMRQFSELDELADCLARTGLPARDLRAFGVRLADFHQQAAVAATDSPYGGFDAVRDQVLANVATLLATLPGDEDSKLLARLAQWTDAAANSLEPMIRMRKASGAVRECHGDLHARNIVRWRGELLAFDCLEFDPALRWIDVISDVAFLFMDLIAYERTDLAYAFLNGYLEQSGDYEGLRLLPFYGVYRALVRAKVDALAARAASANRAAELRRHLAHRLAVAAQFLKPAEPALIIMNGVTASGKSSVSDELTLVLGAVRVRSDLERKRLAGVPALRHGTFDVGADAYTQALTDRTYARLLECAEATLAAGCPVIIDATFLDRSQREPFHALANESRCPFLIVSCSAPLEVLHGRIAQRAAAGTDPSEATVAVLERQMLTQDALTEHEQTHSIRLRTDVATSLASGVDAIRAWIGRAAPCTGAMLA